MQKQAIWDLKKAKQKRPKKLSKRLPNSCRRTRLCDVCPAISARDHHELLVQDLRVDLALAPVVLLVLQRAALLLQLLEPRLAARGVAGRGLQTMSNISKVSHY